VPDRERAKAEIIEQTRRIAEERFCDDPTHLTAVTVVLDQFLKFCFQEQFRELLDLLSSERRTLLWSSLHDNIIEDFASTIEFRRLTEPEKNECLDYLRGLQPSKTGKLGDWEFWYSALTLLQRFCGTIVLAVSHIVRPIHVRPVSMGLCARGEKGDSTSSTANRLDFMKSIHGFQAMMLQAIIYEFDYFNVVLGTCIRHPTGYFSDGISLRMNCYRSKAARMELVRKIFVFLEEVREFVFIVVSHAQDKQHTPPPIVIIDSSGTAGMYTVRKAVETLQETLKYTTVSFIDDAVLHISIYNTPKSLYPCVRDFQRARCLANIANGFVREGCSDQASVLRVLNETFEASDGKFYLKHFKQVEAGAVRVGDDGTFTISAQLAEAEAQAKEQKAATKSSAPSSTSRKDRLDALRDSINTTTFSFDPEKEGAARDSGNSENAIAKAKRDGLLGVKSELLKATINAAKESPESDHTWKLLELAGIVCEDDKIFEAELQKSLLRAVTLSVPKSPIYSADPLLVSVAKLGGCSDESIASAILDGYVEDQDRLLTRVLIGARFTPGSTVTRSLLEKALEVAKKCDDFKAKLEKALLQGVLTTIYAPNFEPDSRRVEIAILGGWTRDLLDSEIQKRLRMLGVAT